MVKFIRCLFRKTKSNIYVKPLPQGRLTDGLNKINDDGISYFEER